MFSNIACRNQASTPSPQANPASSSSTNKSPTEAPSENPSSGSQTQASQAVAPDEETPAPEENGEAGTSDKNDAVPPETSTTPSPIEETIVAPQLFDEKQQALPQTEDRPSADSPWLQQQIRLLFDAIVQDDAEKAFPLFFPVVAYEQVKAIKDPARDWEHRLLGAYKRDIHEYHRSLGKFREQARFKELRAADVSAKWVKPGEEGNQLGYYRLMRSRLIYEDHQGRERELGILTMISWRGHWYIVHLAPFK